MAAIRSRSKNAKGGAGIYGSNVIQARMVKIEWTSAQVVRIATRQDINVTIELVNIVNHGTDKVRYDVVKEQNLFIAANHTVWFARSAHREGWYYVIIWDSSFGRWKCGCPHRDHGCHHQREVNEYETQRVIAENARKEREQVLKQVQRASEALLARIDAEATATVAAQVAQAQGKSAQAAKFPVLSSNQYIPDWMMKH